MLCALLCGVQDIEDLQQFGVAHQVDFIAASFVRKASDIDTIRSVLGPRGKDIKIIAKIENQVGQGSTAFHSSETS